MRPEPSTPSGLTFRSNVRHLYLDVLWYGVLAGSSLAFLAIYAAHLGATSLQMGLITAGPAAVNLVLSLPSGRWLESRALISVTFWSSVAHRAGYLALIPLPLLFGPVPAVWAIVTIVAAMSIPGTLLAIAFNAMFADVVHPEWRGHVVGRRNALLAVSLTATSLLCGWLFAATATPLNYQVVFGIGAVGAAMSSYHLGRLVPPQELPPRVGRVLDDAARPGLLRFPDAVREGFGLRFLTRFSGRSLLRLDLLSGPFGPFLAAYLLFYTVQYVPVPLFPLYWVHDLHLEETTISIGNALFYGTMMLMSLRLSFLSARWGHRVVLIASSLAYGLYPLVNALASGPALYWTASLAGGAVWGALNGGLLNRLMERVPQDDRPAHMALHNLALNLGILAGSLLGAVLGQGVGLRSALFLAAALRFTAGLVLVFLA